jgi:hypothetical protein
LLVVYDVAVSPRADDVRLPRGPAVEVLIGRDA